MTHTVQITVSDFVVHVLTWRYLCLEMFLRGTFSILFLSHTQIIIIHLKWIAHHHSCRSFLSPPTGQRGNWWMNSQFEKPRLFQDLQWFIVQLGAECGTGMILLIEGVGYNGPFSAEYFQLIGSVAFESLKRLLFPPAAPLTRFHFH